MKSAWQLPVPLLWFGLSIFYLIASSGPAHGAAASPAAGTALEQHMAQGWQSFQHGNFGQAVVSWREATRLYNKEKQPQAQSTALTYLAEAYQALGQYKQALTSLEAALALAEQLGDQTQIAAVLGSLGNVYIATGPAEKAEQYLHRALELARRLDNARLIAVILNNLGNLFTSQNKPTDALAAYRDSVVSAQHVGLRALTVRAQTNAAMAAIQDGQYTASKTLLDEALEQIPNLESSHGKAYGLIKIGLTYADLQVHLPDLHDTLLLLAAKAFEEARAVAQLIGDHRAASYAWGYLGHLYEVASRYQEALQLTRQAVAAAQQVHAPESLYRWQWQTGRLLKAQGHSDAAIAAYRRAVEIVQPLRPELSTSYGKPHTPFRTSVGPVYFELVDLLLQRVALLPDREHAAPYLHEARQIVELFKAAELRDYFRDDCVDAAQRRIKPLDIVSQTAVVVYPILLPDRLELLVSLPTGLAKFTVPADADTVERVARRFRQALQDDAARRYLQHAQRLYDWLIRPLEASLTSLNIDTLVFVPDGALRMIPMAALHDGQQFLISKYALATTPSLDLSDPRPIQRHQQVLAAGVTASVQGGTELPYVRDELHAIVTLYGGKVLLNQDFHLARLQGELQKEPFGIVHVASHGQFVSNVEQSFVLTFDDKLTMNQLEQLVRPLQFRDVPLELLTLSACETAVGDDRAALGLAGIAIKAGARSALATLWRVEDKAAAVLVVEFYRQLHDPSVSRAVALQRAQLKLLHDPDYDDPFFWSAFLLINNWL